MKNLPNLVMDGSMGSNETINLRLVIIELKYLEGFWFLLQDFLKVIFVHGEIFEFPWFFFCWYFLMQMARPQCDTHPLFLFFSLLAGSNEVNPIRCRGMHCCLFLLPGTLGSALIPAPPLFRGPKASDSSAFPFVNSEDIKWFTFLYADLCALLCEISHSSKWEISPG